jgi:hypothetical protein
MTIIEGVNATQNTTLSNKVNLTGSLNQTVSGNVTISQDLVVGGNLIITGNVSTQNVQQLAVADPLLVLGIGNYVSDTKDIGFAAHYNDGTNAHAGLIRDSGTKEFYVFQGYTPELDANNNIVVTDPSFRTANLNANVVKANIITNSITLNNTNIALGTNSGAGQGIYGVAIGSDAGSSGQGSQAVSIGNGAGQGSQGAHAVAIGTIAGQNSQAAYSIAVGLYAGWAGQQSSSVAIGAIAGQQNQGYNSVAIGQYACQFNQGHESVAIGSFAGYQNQGNYAVAIGNLAGQYSQAAYSIALNANASPLFANNAGFYVNPVRNDASSIAQSVYFNPVTQELTYAQAKLKYTTGTTSPISGNVSGDQWYNTSTDVLYEYISDGTSAYWVDIGSPTISSGATVFLPSRSTTSVTTSSLANNSTANVRIVGFKSYILQKMTTSCAAWVRLYTDGSSMANDASRLQSVDPLAGTGVIAEFVTTGANTQLVTPGVFGFNNDVTPNTTIYAAITNQSGTSNTVTVTLSLLQTE